MASWSTDDIPEQAGRTALITGANSGIGLATAKALAAKGARVLMACRDPQRAEVAREDVASVAAAPAPEIVALDLGDLGSVRSAADGLIRRAHPIDLLINNAGIMAVPKRTLTSDGFEMQFGTNHLGHFVLTGLLLPLFAGQPGARVVTVSSLAHRGGKVDFNNIQRERDYGAWSAYQGSKLANLLFAFELERRLRAAGAAATSLAAHPGVSHTRLQETGPKMAGGSAFAWASSVGVSIIGQSNAAGALPSLRAATDPEARGGEFYGPGWPGEFRGPPKQVDASKAAQDTRAAAQLWAASEELTGVRYDFAAAPGPGS